jgi:hypothetical protein
LATGRARGSIYPSCTQGSIYSICMCRAGLRARSAVRPLIRGTVVALAPKLSNRIRFVVSPAISW